MEGFWPIESRENPRWESLLSPRGLFLGFPRMQRIRVGGFQPPGQKHSGGKSGRFFLIKQREIAISL